MERGWQEDAREFGRLVKNGGWWLAYLAARRVVEGTGHGVHRKYRADGSDVPSICSVRQFADEAGTLNHRVQRHLKAWDRAAEAGVVPPRSAFVGTSIEIELPDDEVTPFDDYYIGNDKDIRGWVQPSKQSTTPEAIIAAVKTNPDVADAVIEAVKTDHDAVKAVAQAIEDKHKRPPGPRPRPKPEDDPIDPLAIASMLQLLSQAHNLLKQAVKTRVDGPVDPDNQPGALRIADACSTYIDILKQVITGEIRPLTEADFDALLGGGI